jgi:hypothetical protein
MDRNTKLTLLVAGLIAIGFVLGIAVGSGDEPKATAQTTTVVSTNTITRTETRTETVTHTRTRTRYRTRVKVKYRTVTEPAPIAPSDEDDGGGDGCSAEYVGACVPDAGYDVNCPDLAESDFDSVGSDPYGLDRDGDGIACES